MPYSKDYLQFSLPTAGPTSPVSLCLFEALIINLAKLIGSHVKFKFKLDYQTEWYHYYRVYSIDQTFSFSCFLNIPARLISFLDFFFFTWQSLGWLQWLDSKAYMPGYISCLTCCMQHNGRRYFLSFYSYKTFCTSLTVTFCW